MSTRTQINHSNVVPLYKDVVATNRVFMAVLEIVSRVANQAQLCSVLVQLPCWHQTRRIDLVVGHWWFERAIFMKTSLDYFVLLSPFKVLWRPANIRLNQSIFCISDRIQTTFLVSIWIYAYAWFEIGYHKPRNYSKKLLKLSFACYYENIR